MAEKTLKDLFIHTLKDVYYAERAILKALPKMEKAAQAPELKQAFATHREQTQNQIERLKQVFELVGKRAQGEPCEAIQGIIAEGEEVIEAFGGSEAGDAGLIAGAQAVEHYEISRYGSLKAWAERIGMDEAVSLLDETLAEEKQTDELLTQIAEASANETAAADGAEEEEAEPAPAKRAARR